MTIPTPPYQPATPQPHAYGPPAEAAAARPGNPAGLVSVIAVAGLVLLDLINMGMQTAAYSDGGYMAIGFWSFAIGIVRTLVALVAVIFGIIGLTRRDRPKALAGIGLGAGALSLTSSLMWSLIYPVLMAAMSAS